MFFRRHPCVRDGLLSIILVIAWIIGTDKLCRPPEGIVCELSRYVLYTVMGPVRFVSGKLMDFVFYVTGIVPPPPGVETAHRGVDFVDIGGGISLFLLYWFLLGSIICMIWRFVRG